MARRKLPTETTRECPGCNQEKTFPDRNETCSRDCAAVMSTRRATTGKGSVAAPRFRINLKAMIRKALDTMKADIPHCPEGREREHAQREYDKLSREARTVGLA